MKKLYFIMFSILLIVFIYWGFSGLSSALPKLLYSAGYIFDETKAINSGTNLFKSTPENTDLINAMISLHTDFTNNPPVLDEKNENNIINFYKLEKYFPSFNSYYITKIKLANTLYTELDKLYNDTNNLSKIELNTYFKNNTEYLESNWGLNKFSEFVSVVNTIKSKNGLKATSCELENSYLYSNSSNSLNFRIIVKLDKDLEMYLGVLISFDETSDYQTYPVIRFYGTEGGGYS